MKILISGGGTGGHIFPALSIANAVKARNPKAEILFVGAQGRMEMERVPAAGYEIMGLPVAGFDRKRLWRNFGVLIKLWRSMRKAKRVLRDFQPDIAVGVGGYASGPMLKEAQKRGIPTLIQEQNSYAGVTNKLLAANANRICVAYDGMERFFPAAKIIKTGNPVRKNILEVNMSREDAKRALGFNPNRPLIVVVGGSLGARTINDAMKVSVREWLRSGASVLWQTGKFYADECIASVSDINDTNLKVQAFVSRMDLAYRAADLVVSRAGASTISEIQLVGVPAVLVPSPNVAEDHQRKNAEALSQHDAAVMILDKECASSLCSTVTELLRNPGHRETLSTNASAMALANADEAIVDEIESILAQTAAINDFKTGLMNKIYFVGAGGIGMAALERYFVAKGCAVAGYDRTPSELTDHLQKEGVRIAFEDDVKKAIPHEFRNPADTLVVYTPAVPEDTAVMTFFRQGGFEMVKRAALLGKITRESKGICFAGTHGKTTTSSMAAHILHNCDAKCNAFLGGVLRNYDSNFLLAPESPWSVIEADEFDRSFHHLRPWISVITATDPDHLDIYGTEEAYLESFAHFTELVQPGGALVIHEGLKLKPRPSDGVKLYTYSRDHGDFHAANIRYGNGEIHFDFVHPGGLISDINLGVPVEVNIDNAIAALAACWLTGEMDTDKARAAMGSFLGAKRRFEFWLKGGNDGNGPVVIDDYAHHPDELKASIKSVKALYPERKLTVAFQPHLYTRTRDFAEGFAHALDLADEVILLDIYPARELPIEGVTSKKIFDRLKCAKKSHIKRDDLIETIKNTNFEILLTAGAGDIADLVPGVVEAVIGDRW